MEIEPNPARGEGYILVVDDVPAMAELIAGWLHKAGYHTKVANTYGLAKKLADDSAPKYMIISDDIKKSDIPIGDFIQCRWLSSSESRAYSDIPRICIASWNPRDFMHACFAWYDYVLTKPLEEEVFIDFINRDLKVYTDNESIKYTI